VNEEALAHWGGCHAKNKQHQIKKHVLTMWTGFI